MGDTATNGGGDANGGDGGNGNNPQDQGQNGGAGNADAKDSKKRDPLYENLPDDHPLVKRHEQLKAESKDWKAKAKIVDDAEEAKKSDAQKIADLQAKVDAQPKAVAESLRDHLVELHGIDKDDAELFLTGDTPELVLKQVARLLDQAGGGSKRKNYVKNEGGEAGKPAESENGKFAKSLFGGGED